MATVKQICAVIDALGAKGESAALAGDTESALECCHAILLLQKIFAPESRK